MLLAKTRVSVGGENGLQQARLLTFAGGERGEQRQALTRRGRND